ncbi:hypothetical protein IRJ41_019103 [Triplophysa rosa]|uniref:Uncharacterized protein n=1 Tax=Triplophysa rosa TaxID=992332 RepID=A0A9W7T6S4_TRIRA|nr:hypothetical protein IRJ41_019103 [Triplophysa rosa]
MADREQAQKALCLTQQASMRNVTMIVFSEISLDKDYNMKNSSRETTFNRELAVPNGDFKDDELFKPESSADHAEQF